MLTQLQGERLPEWIAAVRADDLPNLHTFISGLERDLVAVTAGLTSALEMYGRTSFKLLRKRVLLAS